MVRIASVKNASVDNIGLGQACSCVGLNIRKAQEVASSMSFVLMEDLKRPITRRVTVIASIRIFRPVMKIARFTFRSSRFLLQKSVWVILGDRPSKPTSEEVQVPAKL